jgi:hypothetical protein
VWLIPLLAIAWANLHGSFPLLLVLVGLATLDDALRGRWPDAVQLAVVGVVAALATLINPFGLDVWGYVLNLASNPTIASQVSEWRPPSPLEGAGALFYGSMVAIGGVAIGGLAVSRRDRRGVIPRTAIAPLLTLVAFAGLGALTGRGLAWWALAAPVALASIVAVALGADSRRHGDPSVVGPSWVPEALRPVPATERPRPLNTVIVVVLLLAFVALLPSWRPVGPAGVPEGLLSHAPQSVAVELSELVDPRDLRRQQVWNPQLWGSWLEFAVPDLWVALDSRLELYPAAIWADAEAIASGASTWQALLDRYGATLVIVAPEQTGLREALEASDRWIATYRGVDGSVWRRSGPVVEAER